MHLEDLRQQRRQSGLEWTFAWFIRLLALTALASGVFYWVRLIGLQPGLLWRFDLMPWMWQTAVVGLAVLMPVAACGLWMRAPWGPVLWFVAAMGEIGIYSVFERYFESRPLTVAFNAVCIVAYIVFRIWLALEKRQQAKAMLSNG